MQQQQQQTHVVTSQPLQTMNDYDSPNTVVVPRMWSYRLCSCCQDMRECNNNPTVFPTEKVDN